MIQFGLPCQLSSAFHGQPSCIPWENDLEAYSSVLKILTPILLLHVTSAAAALTTLIHMSSDDFCKPVPTLATGQEVAGHGNGWATAHWMTG